MIVTETNFPDLRLLARGKVRDVYEIDNAHLLIVATDRISAFDCVLPTPIPRKGEVLTQTSRFWFEKLAEIGISHHLLTTEIDEMPVNLQKYADVLSKRSMFVKKTYVFPVECVVRGFLSGSGWKDYQATGSVSGHDLPPGLRESENFPHRFLRRRLKLRPGTTKTSVNAK